jgi:hypothetical protein
MLVEYIAYTSNFLYTYLIQTNSLMSEFPHTPPIETPKKSPTLRERLDSLRPKALLLPAVLALGSALAGENLKLHAEQYATPLPIESLTLQSEFSELAKLGPITINGNPEIVQAIKLTPEFARTLSSDQLAQIKSRSNMVRTLGDKGVTIPKLTFQPNPNKPVTDINGNPLTPETSQGIRFVQVPVSGFASYNGTTDTSVVMSVEQFRDLGKTIEASKDQGVIASEIGVVHKRVASNVNAGEAIVSLLKNQNNPNNGFFKGKEFSFLKTANIGGIKSFVNSYGIKNNRLTKNFLGAGACGFATLFGKLGYQYSKQAFERAKQIDGVYSVFDDLSNGVTLNKTQALVQKVNGRPHSPTYDPSGILVSSEYSDDLKERGVANATDNTDFTVYDGPGNKDTDLSFTFLQGSKEHPIYLSVDIEYQIDPDYKTKLAAAKGDLQETFAGQTVITVSFTTTPVSKEHYNEVLKKLNNLRILFNLKPSSQKPLP